MKAREKILKGIVMLAAMPALNSCQGGSDTGARTIAAETLADKYSVSVEAARREFDGKELVVRGYVSDVVDMPNDDETEGMILLGSANKAAPGVQCWFSRYESAEFEGMGPGQTLTVRGIFNGESGVALKFCKLVQKN